MKSITLPSSSIHFNATAYQELNAYLQKHGFSCLFILVDSNTNHHCLQHFLGNLITDTPIEIIEIEAGEPNKTIETCLGVWKALSELGADRKSLIINLGGGMVTDLGGFVASTFKRGIPYINVPTSLLAMVDASVGGKTGVDLDALKNQIGIINPGKMVLIDTAFLDTLPQNQLKSGWAEMLKHGLIADRNYWNQLTDLSTLTLSDMDRLIFDSITIKKNIITTDPFETHERKYLNFGHTLGHAIESYFLGTEGKPDLLHGEAIAIGMVLECHLSSKLLGFPVEDCDAVKQTISRLFKRVAMLPTEQNAIIELMKYDKKNEHGKVNFVLLEAIGTPKVDCNVAHEAIVEAFAYYLQE